MSGTQAQRWSKPYHGVQHYGEFSVRARWATVENHGTFVVLSLWFPGCQFSPTQREYPNVVSAQRHAERWVDESYVSQRLP